MMARFLEFSAEVTAFSAFELQGTGQAQSYLDTVTGIVGADLLGELLDAWDRVRTEPQPARDMRLRREVFGDEKLGPIARNIVRLWYIGIWSELPRAWTETFGALEKNVGFMVSPAAYTEGLLWPAIGANPSGAKAPGYGSWALPPRIPSLEGISSDLYPDVPRKGES
jgi:hypothetical protein